MHMVDQFNVRLYIPRSGPIATTIVKHIVAVMNYYNILDSK